MKILSGKVVVGIIVFFGILGIAGTHFKINSQSSKNLSIEIAQKIAKDKMNQFSKEFEQKLKDGLKPNRLIHEKSPYLLQHAFNPVNWYSWGEEAFEKARLENKPIFLSIGYSTCHWCHVMERESFENDKIAALMNEHFICIKVDREERPDVDKVYMTTVQALTGSGGWPLSAWLTPDLKPYYGGTYFPPESKYGRPGFPDILLQLSKAWQEQRDKVVESSEKIVEAIQQQTTIMTDSSSVDFMSLMRSAHSQFLKTYDEKLGGFGQSPKFPRPVAFNFLLRYYARNSKVKQALEMTLNTLKGMWSGGMYDHLGGGFHRYSVDAYWRVPHFEKMLYDQSQLVCSYLEAYQITHDAFYADVATEVLEYVLRDMTDPDGGFYSAEDADSAPDPNNLHHKEEGVFYMWTSQEIVELLGDQDAEIVNYMYGVSESGNTINDPHNEFANRNVLYAAYTLEDASRRFSKSESEIRKVLAQSKPLLFEYRLKRPRPHLDDKIVTAWNGLMISAFASAYQVLHDEKHLNAAIHSADFVLQKIYDSKSKTLRRRFRDGEAKYPAHLDDYAFFVQGLLDLYETNFDIRWLQHAVALTETMNKVFRDEKNGGFFDTSGEDKSILIRTKSDYDGAEPAGNSIAVLNLMRLSQMLNRKEWWDFADAAMRIMGNRLENAPHAMPQMLATIDFSLDKPKQIIIAGEVESSDVQSMLRAVHEHFLPNKVLLSADGKAGQKYLGKTLPFIESVVKLNNKATAYVCEDYTCQLPTNEIDVFETLLEKHDE